MKTRTGYQWFERIVAVAATIALGGWMYVQLSGYAFWAMGGTIKAIALLLGCGFTSLLALSGLARFVWNANIWTDPATTRGALYFRTVNNTGTPEFMTGRFTSLLAKETAEDQKLWVFGSECANYIWNVCFYAAVYAVGTHVGCMFMRIFSKTLTATKLPTVDMANLTTFQQMLYFGVPVIFVVAVMYILSHLFRNNISGFEPVDEGQQELVMLLRKAVGVLRGGWRFLPVLIAYVDLDGIEEAGKQKDLGEKGLVGSESLVDPKGELKGRSTPEGVIMLHPGYESVEIPVAGGDNYQVYYKIRLLVRVVNLVVQRKLIEESFLTLMSLVDVAVQAAIISVFNKLMATGGGKSPSRVSLLAETDEMSKVVLAALQQDDLAAEIRRLTGFRVEAVPFNDISPSPRINAARDDIAAAQFEEGAAGPRARAQEAFLKVQTEAVARLASLPNMGGLATALIATMPGIISAVGQAASAYQAGKMASAVPTSRPGVINVPPAGGPSKVPSGSSPKGKGKP
jgi:hypothetical protein